ncbi:Rv2253/PknI dimerization domain-containing protein [Mycolicibacterium sp. XJ1819]
MKAGRVLSTIVMTIAMVIGATPYAVAQNDVAINGTFTAFSDGQWAKTNNSLHLEKSVTQTWAITSSCATFQDCTGVVTSDQGWTAELVYMSGRWKVSRTVENWEPCIDGTAHPGQQNFIFWLSYPQDRNYYVGWDKTQGPSGACGFNKVLDVEMPFRLTRQG